MKQAKSFSKTDKSILNHALSVAIESEYKAIAQLDSLPDNRKKSPELRTAIRERESLLRDYDRLRDQLSDDSYGYKRSSRNRGE